MFNPAVASQSFAASTVFTIGDCFSTWKISIFTVNSRVVVELTPATPSSSVMSSVIFTGTEYVPSVCLNAPGSSALASSLSIAVRVLIIFCQLSNPSVVSGLKLNGDSRRLWVFPVLSVTVTESTSLRTLLMNTSLFKRIARTLLTAYCCDPNTCSSVASSILSRMTPTVIWSNASMNASFPLASSEEKLSVPPFLNILYA